MYNLLIHLKCTITDVQSPHTPEMYNNCVTACDWCDLLLSLVGTMVTDGELEQVVTSDTHATCLRVYYIRI